MSDAVYKMAKNGEELIIGMPDTYIHGSKSNIYGVIGFRCRHCVGNLEL
jgi:hypothetical protein